MWLIYTCMLFSFRSADAAKYPKLLSVQTIAFALNERDAARMVKQGLATYDSETNSFNFREFENPRVTVIGSASAWPDVIGSEGFIDKSHSHKRAGPVRLTA